MKTLEFIVVIFICSFWANFDFRVESTPPNFKLNFSSICSCFKPPTWNLNFSDCNKFLPNKTRKLCFFDKNGTNEYSHHTFIRNSTKSTKKPCTEIEKLQRMFENYEVILNFNEIMISKAYCFKIRTILTAY
jgi:hypothetical protein